MTLAKPTMAALTLAALVVSGCTTPPPIPGAGPSSALAPDVLVQEKLPTQPQDFTVLAATGDTIWASFPEGSPWGGNRISRDGGQSWNPGIGYSEILGATGYRGRFGYLAGEDGEGSPYLMDPAHPVKARSLAWTDEGGIRIRAMGVGAALTSKNLLATIDRTRRVSFPKLPASTPGASHRYAFTGDAKYAVRITTTTGKRDYAGVLSTATGKSKGVLRLPRTAQHRVAGSTLYSLVAGTSGLKLCRQPLPSGTANCQQVVSGNRKAAKATLYQFGALSVINDPGSPAPLLVENGQLTTVVLPQGTRSWRGEGSGDPTRPLLRIVDSKGEPHHLRVAADGTTTEWMTVPRTPASLASIALTPTTLLGSWTAAEPKQIWTRPLTEAGLGAPYQLPGLSVSAASGARWLVWTGGKVGVLYDDGVPAARITGGTSTLSGPYLIDGRASVRLVTGRQLVAKGAQVIFGSLVAERARRKSKGFAVTIRDFADSSFTPATVTLSRTGSIYSEVFLWGDWVGTTVDDQDGDFITVLTNYRTGKSVRHRGTLWQLGDGYAVLEGALDGAEPDSDATELAVWNTATDELTRLGRGTSSLAFAADGNRIVYTTETDLIIRTIPGVNTDAPRLLGALTAGKATRKAPWQASLDVTKPLAAGTLTITDRSGRQVRTLQTPEAPAGALRNLSWDGRDEAGKAVAKGRYRWTLQASASDGTGEVVGVSGSGAARGAITVG